jgi:hypothetical protein
MNGWNKTMINTIKLLTLALILIVNVLPAAAGGSTKAIGTTIFDASNYPAVDCNCYLSDPEDETDYIFAKGPAEPATLPRFILASVPLQAPKMPSMTVKIAMYDWKDPVDNATWSFGCFAKLEAGPGYPSDFAPRTDTTNKGLIKIRGKVNNPPLLNALRNAVKREDWFKVYFNGTSGGQPVSIHYFVNQSNTIFCNIVLHNGYSEP